MLWSIRAIVFFCIIIKFLFLALVSATLAGCIRRVPTTFVIPEDVLRACRVGIFFPSVLCLAAISCFDHGCNLLVYFGTFILFRNNHSVTGLLFYVCMAFLAGILWRAVALLALCQLQATPSAIGKLWWFKLFFVGLWLLYIAQILFTKFWKNLLTGNWIRFVILA